MTSSEHARDAAPTAWNLLVQRSINAWDASTVHYECAKKALQACNDLNEFLGRETRDHSYMMWIFQRREAFLAQKTLTKWSEDRLDDFVILPASVGYVTRAECIFLSHFWQKHDDPDPDGKHLSLLQRELRPQSWSYIWVDWSCIPQHPRSQPQATYFIRALRTMPGIIRNCRFAWRYPEFEARMWILYEVAEYTLTSTEDSRLKPFKNIKKFQQHIEDMLTEGVQSTLIKYGYKCKVDLDKDLLTGWLELLVLLTNLKVGLLDIRRILDSLTWFFVTPHMYFIMLNGSIEIRQFEGLVILNGEPHTITPFPRRVSSMPPLPVPVLLLNMSNRL